MPDRIIYIEPFSGISGDMFVGALLDLGGSFDKLQQELRRLPLTGYKLALGKCLRAGIQASKFDVEVAKEPHGSHGHGHSSHGRNFRSIRNMLAASALSPWVKEKSTRAFQRLAEAEGKIHNHPPDEVHFHEVGAVDSIIDIVSSMVLLEGYLPARIVSGTINVGHGTLECQHGIYPVPGPATQALLEGVPVYSNVVEGELTTPTGAAILTTLVDSFGPRPMMKVATSGYGAGSRETPGNANCLRITIGEISAAEPLFGDEQVAVIEAAIDDMNPQIFGYFQEKALHEGALDVYFTPIQMKKNRPAVQLTVVCDVGLQEALARLIFAETTTIGLRFTLARRKTLQRQFVSVDTEYGAVTIKISHLDGQRVNFIPEYEDCRLLAAEKQVALKDVLAAATRAYLRSAHPIE